MGDLEEVLELLVDRVDDDDLGKHYCYFSSVRVGRNINR